MSTDTLNNRICTMIADHLGLDVSDIAENNDLRSENGLAFDDFDMMELAVSIEADFNVEIHDEDTESARTVGDLIAMVKAKVLK